MDQPGDAVKIHATHPIHTTENRVQNPTSRIREGRYGSPEYTIAHAKTHSVNGNGEVNTPRPTAAQNMVESYASRR